MNAVAHTALRRPQVAQRVSLSVPRLQLDLHPLNLLPRRPLAAWGVAALRISEVRVEATEAEGGDSVALSVAAVRFELGRLGARLDAPAGPQWFAPALFSCWHSRLRVGDVSVRGSFGGQSVAAFQCEPQPETAAAGAPMLDLSLEIETRRQVQTRAAPSFCPVVSLHYTEHQCRRAWGGA